MGGRRGARKDPYHTTRRTAQRNATPSTFPDRERDVRRRRAPLPDRDEEPLDQVVGVLAFEALVERKDAFKHVKLTRLARLTCPCTSRARLEAARVEHDLVGTHRLDCLWIRLWQIPAWSLRKLPRAGCAA